jgi:CheY-like chemotaxis protein/phosphoribosyl 1,2-cyclic phosphodiesterase
LTARARLADDGARGRPRSKGLRVYIVDDSRTQAEIARGLLEREGHQVTVEFSSVDALRDIPTQRPDCVLMDIMMPQLDGHELCRRLRALPELAGTKLVMMSAKAYHFERRRALEMGADGYFVKPLQPASFAQDLARLVADTLTVGFWGVRGTLPISRKDSLRYGGNTSCVSVSFPDGRLFVFDAGTGIKALSDALVAAKRTRIDGNLLITHAHWDHINALPFFAPLYGVGHQLAIHGPAHGDKSLRELLSAQMDGVYFPITVREFAASVTYHDLSEGSFEIGRERVRTMLLSHPGSCLGYRLDHGGRSICYVTDNELYLPDSESYSPEYVEQLADFVRDTDLLITDCAYRDEEYPSRVNYGHSCVSQVADLACRADAKRLCLIHHDPDQTDTMVDAKVARAQELIAARGAATVACAPAELSEIEL